VETQFFLLLLAPRGVCLRCNQYCFSSTFQERLAPVLCTLTDTGMKDHNIILSVYRQQREFNQQVVEIDDVCFSALWLGTLFLVLQEIIRVLYLVGFLRHKYM
jgi:hypothetical protein